MTAESMVGRTVSQYRITRQLAACTFCFLGRRGEALDALRKAWNAGYKDADWTRRDPDLVSLHDDPEFERLYPERPDVR